MRRTKKKNDKRRHIRVQPEKKSPVEVDINGQNFLTIIYANDISEGGIGIIVPEKFKGCKINNNVSLVITLPKPLKKSFIVTGRIIHVINEKFGVEFLDLAKENRKLLKQYIKKRLKENPQNQKEQTILKYVMRFNIVVAAITLTLLCHMIYSFKSEKGNNIHTTANEKQIEKNIKAKKTKSTENVIQEVSRVSEFQPYDDDPQDIALNDVDEADFSYDSEATEDYETSETTPSKIDEKLTELNEYNTVLLSDVAGKKINFRGQWFFFYHNNTVGINKDENQSGTGYFYAANYYIGENQIIIEISHEEKAVIVFSNDRLTVGDACSFEKYVEEEEVSKKEAVINKIVDID
ncbi:MAG: PilZ domain-containing protein [Candidatus Magnetomorum sp.]|nr:PilZ domain-containing protein [Candidatus Magnetomorum sp.]